MAHERWHLGFGVFFLAHLLPVATARGEPSVTRRAYHAHFAIGSESRIVISWIARTTLGRILSAVV